MKKLLNNEKPSAELWIVAQLLGDPALEKRAAATFQDEKDKLVVEIRSRLFRGFPSVDAEATLYGFSQLDRER